MAPLPKVLTVAAVCVFVAAPLHGETHRQPGMLTESELLADLDTMIQQLRSAHVQGGAIARRARREKAWRLTIKTLLGVGGPIAVAAGGLNLGKNEVALVGAVASAIVAISEATVDSSRRDLVIAACDYVVDSLYWIESYLTTWRVRAPEETFRKMYFDLKRAPWDPFLQKAGTCGVKF